MPLVVEQGVVVGFVTGEGFAEVVTAGIAHVFAETSGRNQETVVLESFGGLVQARKLQ